MQHQGGGSQLLDTSGSHGSGVWIWDPRTLDLGSEDIWTHRDPEMDPFWTYLGPLLDPYLEVLTILAIPGYPGLGLSGVARPHTIYVAFG